MDGKVREDKGREGKGREDKGREGKGREGEGREDLQCSQNQITLTPYTSQIPFLRGTRACVIDIRRVCPSLIGWPC